MPTDEQVEIVARALFERNPIVSGRSWDWWPILSADPRPAWRREVRRALELAEKD